MILRPTLLLTALVLGGLGCGGARTVPTSDSGTLQPGHQLEGPADWHLDAVIYQVWVKAFADGVQGDGIGDLPGLRSRLDHLQSLGINTIWLSPIFECGYKGENMHGYDTTDYYAVNNRFGTLTDLAGLLDDAHARGMRVLFDFVPNHTSTQHPWFQDPQRRDAWYLWQASVPAGWGLPWGGGGSADVWKPSGGKFFYTSFATDSLADLNWYHPEVQKEMRAVSQHWLDRGFDGMRVDAVRYLCETGPGAAADTPDTHARLKGFRALLDEYTATDRHPFPGGDPKKRSPKVMIAEAWTNDASGITPYYGNGTDEFHLCLDFSAPWAIANAINQGDASRLTGLWSWEQANYPAGYRSASFDSNHDNLISRPATLYAGNKAKVILHEALNLLAPATPIIYYGNEVGLQGAAGSDINLRRPMDWAAVQAQGADADSILSWTRYLTQVRTAYPALRRGRFSVLATDGGPQALAYQMQAGEERIWVVANLSPTPRSFTLTGLGAAGLAPNAPVSSILGDPKGVTALEADAYAVKALPPYGIRVLYASGAAYKGTLHGDLP